MQGNPIAIKEFTGHTPYTYDGQIPDNGFRLVSNFLVTNKGTLKARKGLRVEAGPFTVRQGSVIGIWKTASNISNLVINSPISGVHFVDADGNNMFNPSAIEAHLVLQQDNKAFLFREGTTNVRTWDGTIMTTTPVAGVHANVGIVHKSRMFIANNSTSGTARSQLRYSEIFDVPGSAPNTVNGWPTLNTVDIASTDSDFITAVALLNDVLFVFKRFSTWAVYVEGVPPWTVRNLHPTIGCIGRDTVQAIGGLLYFRSATGVYRTDGTTFERISDPVKEIFDAQPAMDYVTCNARSAAWWGDYYIISDVPTTTPGDTQWEIYNIENGAWSTILVDGFETRRIILYPDYSPPRVAAVQYVAGAATGKILKWEELNGTGDGDGSTSVLGIIQSKNYDFDKPVDRKLVREFAVEAMYTQGTGHVQLSLIPEHDGILGTQQNRTPTDGNESRRLYRFRGPMRCRDYRWELRATLNHEFDITQFVYDMGVVGRVGNAH